MRRLLDYDVDTRSAVFHDYDHGTRTTTIHEIQDQTPFVESVHALKNSDNNSPIIAGKSHLTPYERQGIKNEWMHIARISNEDMVKWMAEGIHLWKIDKCDWTRKKVYQKLNQSGKEKWRTGNAKI